MLLAYYNLFINGVECSSEQRHKEAATLVPATDWQQYHCAEGKEKKSINLRQNKFIES